MLNYLHICSHFHLFSVYINEFSNFEEILYRFLLLRNYNNKFVEK